jgi:hypothetical protein
MKNIYNLLWMVGLALVIASCDGGEASPTEEQIALQRLSKNWALVSAEVDDKEVTEWFPNLQVSYAEGKTYSVQNAVPPIWATSGTFVLQKAGSGYVIKRSDGVDMTVVTLTETNVVIQFGYTALPGARAKSISGSYSFSFQAQ